MNKRMPGLAAALLSGVFAIAACTSTPSADTTEPMSGAGGTMGGGAGAAHAGRGGSSAHAGAPSKAGGSGQAGGADAGAGTMTEAGAGGAPDAPQCPQCASGFCFKDGTCVDCLPSLDNCPRGKVCGSTNQCVPGCKADGTSCASGVCADATSCQSCIGDEECGDGKVCGDNRCAVACKAAQEGTTEGCASGHTCCSQHCIDANTDSQHCGACGTACAKGQFCGSSACSDSGAAGAAGAGGASGSCVACHDTVLANVCSVPQIAVVLDGADVNESAGRALAAALAAHCVPAPKVREVKQTVPDALNPASGRPVSGAHELLVAAGGSFYARLLVYLDSQRVSPIYSYYGNTATEFRNAANDKTVVSRPNNEPTDDHDFFVIQLARDATTGSLVLNAQGFWVSGTIAATYFFEHGMLPTLETFDQGWYVYEWKDKNGDKAPDLNEITQVAAGN